MFIVYIVKSSNGRFYIGSTKDIERRLIEHNSGKTKSLKFLLPVNLVFKQAYPTQTEALRIERWLKNLKSRKIIERIIAEGIIKGP